MALLGLTLDQHHTGFREVVGRGRLKQVGNSSIGTHWTIITLGSGRWLVEEG